MYLTVKQTICFAAALIFAACGRNIEETRPAASLIYIDSLNVGGIDSTIETFIAPYRVKLMTEMNETLAFSSEAILNGPSESPMGNLIADILLDWGYSNQNKGTKPDFSLVNSGGVRNSFPTGPVTLYNVYQTMPFDNTIALVVLTYDELMLLNRQIASRRNMLIGNASLSGDANQPLMKIKGKPLDKEKSYTIITSDYLAQGGDHLNVLKDTKHKEITGVLVRDVIAAYLRGQSKPLSAIKETRIIIDNAD